MAKKLIAAALLVAMVAWAEMAMAPMFIMQTLHAHRAREMSANMTAHHHHATPEGHPCCPGIAQTEAISKAKIAAILEFAAISLPCQNDHRCCFRQAPPSVPAPVSAGNRLSRDLVPAQIAALNPAHNAPSYLSSSTPIVPSPPPNLFGMILRV